jgi:putative membrane protein
MILQSLAGLPAFLVYFCTAITAVVAYLLVYTRITLHNEFQLIRDNDPAAAIALGLSLLGFTLPVVSAIAHAANVVGPWIQFYFWLNQGPNCYRNLRNL